MTGNDSILKPALIIMCGRILGYAACFAIPIVLVRVFDQETFGTYKQLFLIYGTLFTIAQFGMSESLYYFIPERVRRAGKYVFNALIGIALAGVAVAFALWAFRAPIAGLMNNPALADLIPYIGIYLALMMMASVMEIVMTSRNKPRLASATFAVSDIARAGAAVVPVLFIPQLQWLMTWAVVFAAARFVVALSYLVREFGRDFRPGRAQVGRQAAYAAPLGVAIVIEMLQANLHLYFVSYHFDPAVFAIYAIACLQIPIVDYLSQSAGNVLMVRMRELAARGGRAVLGVWHDAIEKLSLILFPLVAVLIVTAHEFVTVLFTRTYIDAAPVFMVWTLSFLFAALPADAALRVFAQTRYLIFANAVRLVVVVALIMPFMHAFGLIGPVLATIVGIALFKWLGLKRVARLLDLRVTDFVPWGAVARTAALAAAAAVPALGVKAALTAPAFVTLVATGATYTASYMLLVLRLGGLRDAERVALVGFVQRPFGFLWGKS